MRTGAGLQGGRDKRGRIEGRSHGRVLSPREPAPGARGWLRARLAVRAPRRGLSGPGLQVVSVRGTWRHRGSTSPRSSAAEGGRPFPGSGIGGWSGGTRKRLRASNPEGKIPRCAPVRWSRPRTCGCSTWNWPRHGLGVSLVRTERRPREPQSQVHRDGIANNSTRRRRGSSMLWARSVRYSTLGSVTTSSKRVSASLGRRTLPQSPCQSRRS